MATSCTSLSSASICKYHEHRKSHNPSLALECHYEAANGHVGTQSLTDPSSLPEDQKRPVLAVVEKPRCRQMDVHTRANQKENNLQKTLEVEKGTLIR